MYRPRIKVSNKISFIILFVMNIFLISCNESSAEQTVEVNVLTNENTQLESENAELKKQLDELTLVVDQLKDSLDRGDVIVEPTAEPIFDSGGYLTVVAPAYSYNKDRGKYIEYSGNKKISIAGDKYEYAVELSAQQVWDSFSIYNLKGEYTKFSGTLCHSDDAGEYANNSAIFHIYLDDEEVLELDVNAGMAPYDIEIDVTEVRAMKFLLEGDEFGGSAVYAIGNPYLQ